MRAFIWIVCFFALSVLIVLLKNVGIVLGGIPMAILFLITWWGAKMLTKKIDSKDKQTSNVQIKMRTCISSFMSKYAAEKQGDIGDIACIFAHAIQTINSSSEKDLLKVMRTNGVTAECGALNILQNFAMVEIKYASLKDLAKGFSDEGLYDLYNAVNEEKLNKGYISKQQYEENKSLGNKLHYVPTEILIL